MTLARLHFDDLERHIGAEICRSDWFTIDQGRIDFFAAATYDPDPQHIDPAHAAAGPFGATIAFGFQLLSYLTMLTRAGQPRIEGVVHELNYGLDRVRFISPVKVGSRIRNRGILAEVRRRDDGAAVMVTRNSLDIDGQDKPAMTAEWLALLAPAGGIRR